MARRVGATRAAMVAAATAIAASIVILQPPTPAAGQDRGEPAANTSKSHSRAGIHPSGGGGIAGGSSTCCSAQATPGCNDPECQSIVCAADAFCCNKIWDSICADQANQWCASCGGTPPFACGNGVCEPPWESSASCGADCPPPANDNCADAIEAFDGVTPFATLGATTDGLPHPNQCNFFGEPQINQDIWFTYVALQTGMAEFALCNSDYDT
jgi:hypothetical protein